jgi:hypothetical protein
MYLRGLLLGMLALGMLFGGASYTLAQSRATLTLEVKTSCEGEIKDFCYNLDDWFYNRKNPYWINYVIQLKSPEGQPLKNTPVFFVVLDVLHSRQYASQKYTDANGSASYRFRNIDYEKDKNKDNTYRAQARVGTFTTDEEGNIQFNRDTQVWNVTSNQVSVRVDIPELYPDLPRPPVSQGSLRVDADELSFKNASLTGGDWKYIRVISGSPPFRWDNVYKEYGDIAPRGLWGEMGIYTVQPRTLGLLNIDILLSTPSVNDTVIVTDANGNRAEVSVEIDYLNFDDVMGGLP